MKLYFHQDEAIAWLAQRPKAILALDAGLGKTAIAALDLTTPAIVICPASLKLNWKSELKMWRPELTVHVVMSHKDALAPADVTIVNYDILNKVDLPAVATLIVDESHAIKNWRAKRTKAVMRLIKTTSKVRLLTATPIINRPNELWTSVYAIGAIKIGYHEWGLRYCAGWFTPWGVYDFSGSSNEEKLQKVLAPVMLRMTKAQCLDLPEKIYRIIALDLPVDKREKKFTADQIEKPESIPFEAISDIRKLNAERKLPDALLYIINILESVEKVVVFAHHTHIIAELVSSLKSYGPVALTGESKIEDRNAAIMRFQTDKTCRVFVGNIAAAGVGITLTAANHVVFVEAPWSPALLHQAADRTHRIGQKNNVTVDVLTISGSIDDIILHKILTKEKVIEKIIVEESKTISTLLRELSCIIDS